MNHNDNEKQSSFHRTIKEEHFKNLVAVAFADGILDVAESRLLEEKAIEYGLSAKEAEEIIENANSLEFVVPFNQVDRENQLSDLVYMAIVDGVLLPEEYQLCLGIAHRLGFDQPYLDKLIKSSKERWTLLQKKG